MTDVDLAISPVARLLLGEPNPALSTRGQWRYGRKGSLAVDLAKNIWFDHEAGKGGGVLDLVCREIGGSRGGAFDWLREQGLVTDNGDDIGHRKEVDSRRDALVLWEASHPVFGTPAAEYLACRGILIPPPKCIRCHAGINALVAAIQQRDGTVSGIQRIFLTTDRLGTRKRERLSLGSIKHGAFRLTPIAETLQIAESVEDGLALLQMTGRPTWAVPGAGFMADFEPPPEVRHLVLAPDHDKAGIEAIEKALRQLIGRNVQVSCFLPPPGTDWCDLLEVWEERAAIAEFDGGRERGQAELLAWQLR